MFLGELWQPALPDALAIGCNFDNSLRGNKVEINYHEGSDAHDQGHRVSTTKDLVGRQRANLGHLDGTLYAHQCPYCNEGVHNITCISDPMCNVDILHNPKSSDKAEA